MTKLEFLTALAGRLAMLAGDERQKTLDFYGEMIDDRMEEGMSEEEAVASLEPVEEIAQEILCDQPLPDLLQARADAASKAPRRRSALQITLIILGFPLWFPLLLAGGIVVLALYLVIWSLIVALYAVVGALGIYALMGLGFGVWQMFLNPASGMFLVGTGVICAGLCIFAVFGAQGLSLQLIRLTTRLGRWVKSLLIRKERI